MPAASYIDAIESVLNATQLRGTSGFSWFGKEPVALPGKIRRALSHDASKAYLSSMIGSHLYTQFYCKGFACPLQWQAATTVDGASESSFARELAEANTGSGCWSSDWEFIGQTDATVVVSKGALQVGVPRYDCRGTADGERGMRVEIRLPKGSQAASPGFYLARGNGALSRRSGSNITRVYWNITAAGASALIRRLTSQFNTHALPFELKVLSDRRRFTRCDAAVLYFNRFDYPRVAPLLAETYQELSEQLQPRTPVFTKKLAPGLGVADEPPSGESFGLSRCALLADGLVDAHERRLKDFTSRLHAVMARFEAANISLTHPYLSPDSEDIYALDVSPAHSRRVRRTSDPRCAEPLATADAIGRVLCRTAHTSGEQCNWVGVTEHDPEGRTLSSLGPDLYSGTAGIGLFLAELSALTGDKAAHRTARSAVEHALRGAEGLHSTRRNGLYDGALGIAFAAARAGHALRDAGILERARALAVRVAVGHCAGGPLDLISGNAGMLAGLTVLNAWFAEPVLLEACVRLADELVRRAVPYSRGVSWKTINALNEYHLTGLSHGTAGIALGLLTAYAATHNPTYRDYAVAALDYERAWFDPARGNWPDLRESEAHRGGASSRAFTTFWCHGAPGIVLSRLLAYEILGHERWKDEAIIALRTTAASVEAGLDAIGEGFSLCHGLAGNAEILTIGSRAFADELPELEPLARCAAEIGMERYAQTPERWPCGMGMGKTPGLMTGLAGIGHFYCRMRSPSTLPILSIRADVASEEARG